MAYQDLYADADLYFSYNNVDTYTTTAQLKVAQNPTLPWTFAADGPAGTETNYCVRASNYTTTPKYYMFENFPAGTDYARSFSTWVKVVPSVPMVSGTTSIQPNSMLLFINDPSSGSTDDDRLQINFGTYNSTVTGGSDRFIQLYSYENTVSTSTAGRVSSFTNRKIPLDEWVHIAYVVKEHPTLNAIEKVIYVNGVCWYYQTTTNKSFQNLKWEVGTPTIGGVTAQTFLSTASANSIVYQSHTGFWNRELTKEEIRAQAWYGHQNEDYNTLIMSDNPTVYFDLDNTVKTSAHSVYGEAWEPFDASVSPAWNVNQDSFANKKGWTNILDTTTAANNRIRNTGTTLRTRLGQVIRSGEYSIEFWFKITDKPAVSRYILDMDVTVANYKNGMHQFQITNAGNVDVRSAYRSGTTTYLAGSATASFISNVAAGYEAFTLHPGGTNAKNWADNQWHKFTYTMSISDGASFQGTAGRYEGVMYVDGCRVGSRAWINTYGWLDGIDPVGWLDLGTTSATSTNRDVSLAALAIYPRRLTEKEIEEHFIAGKDFVTDQGKVKYYDGSSWITTVPKVWNGTAWVDWVKKYWNGTSWVDLP